MDSLHRRRFVKTGMVSLAGTALAYLESNTSCQAASAQKAAKAKQVVLLGMMGGASQLDLFDYKPKLGDLDGQPLPESWQSKERFANIDMRAKIWQSPFKFKRCGEAGMWRSELIPHFEAIANHVCLVQAMRNDEINHPGAQLMMTNGFNRVGRPSAGAWIDYGLGAITDELPAYVALNSGAGIECGEECFSNGFLPSEHRAVMLSTGAEPIHYLNNPRGVDRKIRGKSIEVLKRLDQIHFEEIHDPKISQRVTQYEMAFQLQSKLPEVCNLKSETEATLRRYGCEPDKQSFAANCLLARRLLERGVRFVQLNHGGWDHHAKLKEALAKTTRETDQAAAALVQDLHERGMLEETIVIWATEFGRTPMMQGNQGRDHHKTFSIWVAGGGFKAGNIHGGTDELGYDATHGAFDFHDLHATILHLLGIEHTKLTYWYTGRNFRLTDVSGVVQTELLA